MKRLSAYLAESARTHEFRLKTICELTDEQLDKLETHLRKYEAYDIDAPVKTIMQKRPLDFYNVGPSEVYFLDFKTKLPLSPFVLVGELCALLGINEREIRVRNANEPGEIQDREHQESETDKKKYKPRLTDEKYSEYKDAKSTDYHGEKHLTKFLRDLKKQKIDISKEFKVKK